MAASSTFKISDDVRDVLARSTITATTVALPDGQLERKLYEQVNKALEGAGGKWNRSKRVHVFERDPREALGMAVETGKATNVRTALQAFYTPPGLAERVVRAAELKPGMRVLEPSIGEGALALAAIRTVGANLVIHGFDVDRYAAGGARAAIAAATQADRPPRCDLCTIQVMDFLTVQPPEGRGRPSIDGAHCERGEHGEMLASRPRAEAVVCDDLFDAVLMNPPFSGGQDIAHVTHAMRFLKPGGRLAAIMGPGWRTAQTKAAEAFRELVEAASGTVEDIEAGTFEHTGVATVLVVLRKPA